MAIRATMEDGTPPLLELYPLDATAIRAEPVRPPGPLGRIARWLGRDLLRMVVLIVPMVVLTVYLTVIAADMYETEAHFVVRGLSASSGLGSITAIVPTAGLSRSNDDTHSVNAYITSRDAIDRLVREQALLDKLSVPEADFYQRFPRPLEKPTRERLLKRLDDFISVSFDTTSGIGTLKVRMFRADHARDIANALMGHSEELINRLNQRARADSIRFASDVVVKAEERVAAAQARIAEFRSTESVFDPAQQSSATLDLMNVLSAEIVQLRALVSELTTTAPNSPQLNALQARIRSLEKQVAEQRVTLTGTAQSLAPKLSRYEQLVLERELATKALTSALASVENARQDGDRQQLYLERIVAPSLPDQPTHPRRMIVILTALLVLGSSYCVLRWLYDVVMEHQP